MNTKTPKAPKVLVPPINFSLVSRGLYRSGHPNRKNFPFLLGLSLKTIIYLESTTYRPDSQAFIDESSIALHTYDISDESKLFTPEGKATIEEILRLVLDTRNHPLLIHDDMGKSVVSVICALVRRMERWSLTGIFAEGDMFAGQAGGSEGSGIGEAGREVGHTLISRANAGSQLICSLSLCSTRSTWTTTRLINQSGSTRQ
jgi:hypothetical protein